MIFVVLGAVVFVAYSALVFVDARGWGVPRWKRVERFHCTHVNCHASFRYHGWNDTTEVMRLHELAAHQAEDAKQLWPEPLPTRNLDFATRRREIVQVVDDRASDIVLVNGVKVRLLPGGKTDAARARRSR